MHFLAERMVFQLIEVLLYSETQDVRPTMVETKLILPVILRWFSMLEL